MIEQMTSQPEQNKYQINCFLRYPGEMSHD